MQIFMVMLISLMLRYKIETKNENAYTIGVLLILLNVLGILSLVVLAIYRTVYGGDEGDSLAKTDDDEGRDDSRAGTKTSSFSLNNPLSLLSSLVSGSLLDVTRGRSKGHLSEDAGLKISSTELAELRRQASTTRPDIRGFSKYSSSDLLSSSTSKSARFTSSGDSSDGDGESEKKEKGKEKGPSADGIRFTQENPMAGLRNKQASKTPAAAGEEERRAAGGVGEKSDNGDSWEKVLDPSSGHEYYFHRLSNEVRWDRPEEYRGDA